jgi:predicted aspartyl protease
MARTTRFMPGVTILAACGAVAFSHPGHPPIAAAATRYQAGQQPVAFQLFRDQRIVFDGTINGRKTAMMLDSGAGMTVVDRAFAESIGLRGSQTISVRGAGGSSPGQIATGVSLDAAGLSLTGLSVLILDMSSIERAIGRRIPVVLGREAFTSGIVTIDFPRRRLSFSDRAGFRPPADAVRVDLREHGRLPAVSVSIAGLEPVEADLDLGNGGTLLVSQAYWSGQARLAGLRHAEGQSGGVGGMFRARRVTLPEIRFAGMAFTNVPATLSEDPKSLPVSGANVGIEMLKPFSVSFDIAGGRLFLQGSGQRPSFGRERVGARFELAADRLHTAYVSPDGPAAAAGLKTGNDIIAIDGQKVDAAYYERPDWTRGAAGKRVRLDRADGGPITIALADYF